MTPPVDVVVIGAGIVGLATARALQHHDPALDVVVVEKEHEVAHHQSGRNSGVIHSGIYYTPGSNKAEMVSSGRRAMIEFARRHDIAHDICGKVIVATGSGEIQQLDELARRADANGIPYDRLGPGGVRDHEPHADALAGLWIPSTGIIDFGAVCRALATEVEDAGGAVVFSHEVAVISPRPGGGRRVGFANGSDPIDARATVNCAGLQSDRVAALGGSGNTAVRILPFRGEYHELVPERRHLVRGLIYPVPDPRFPFLGVHFTRMTDGSIHAGPNAVAALSREGYRWRDVDRRGLAELALRADSLRLAGRYWRTGVAELMRSASRRLLVRSLRRLVPEVRLEDLRRAGSGVRAQALRGDGTLEDDFVFGGDGHHIDVLNAPSPGATASLEIGRVIADRVITGLAGPSLK